MSERVESNIIPFKGKNYITVTTIEGDDGEPKKTEVYEKITEDRYNEIAEADGNFDNLSISPTHGRRVLLLTTPGAIKKSASDSTTTAYADSDFKREIQQTGKTSLNANLNAGSIESVKDETGKTREQIREYYPEHANTALENIVDSIDFNSNNVPQEITTDKRRLKYETLFYPEDIATSKQDKIIFGMRYFSGRREVNFNLASENPFTLGKRPTETIQGSVTLPIPGGIQDENSVQFDGSTFDLGQAAAAGAILNPVGAAQGIGQFLRDAVTKSPTELQEILSSPDAQNIVAALRLGLAQSFTGGNLLSRFGGGVLNPNMELLFEAPKLRSFKFVFTMSARSRTEATQIKKIIRFFKQGMSVKKSNNNIFVVSPNIFTINYKTGDGREHPSIGRIKNCALLNLNTTYGNGNTYMTYDDPDRTMTQYKIDLTFQELEPITEDDYLEIDERSARVSQGVPIGPLQGSQDFSDRGGIGF